jgi:hypothetical protein
MNDKGHFYISLAKSILRICGCCGAAVASFSNPAGAIACLAVLFVLAEGLGIAEEIVDKR